MHPPSRFNFIDNLRCFALLLGIVFHAALAYSPYFHNIWLSADSSKAVIFDGLTHWLHLFRMPVFFVIAGFCSALIITKKGAATFIKQRLKRILLPFLVFLPLVIASFIHVLSWGADIATPLPPIYAAFNAMTEPQISTAHLWFLWILIQLCLLHWSVYHISGSLHKRLNCTVNMAIYPLILMACCFVTLLAQPTPFPAPDKLLPQLWALTFYGAFYLFGIILFHNPALFKRAHSAILPLSLTAILSLTAYLVYLPEAPTLQQVIAAAKQGAFTPSGIQHMQVVAIQAVAIVSWTTLILLLGYRFFNQKNNICRYLSDASYWVYLIHVPVLLYIQMPLINTALPAIVKLIISVVGTLSISLLTYHFAVKHTVIGRLLTGNHKNIKKQRDVHT
ncbi:acyltransferase family protein [Pseudoalteromonas luteoviolacea]|uniref:Acyltransferase 3 domain-containing protein n=1 Tax=Pseudoalteromonas luteoviolacea S4054 TaxID=1129367 RepID=A0A0F6AB22_9GAMM|nr:acyltransferase family protein [Pseudoalteromonas luteoviolacea]AOT06870.1 hypothetical protein S4054249_02805 [Pseudoalteromonas luteoviolacea]AOT11788.1 hypothetical protein S40542_02805 [Pseudoalteromonas luteoviolacea]AOT16700.1 hypothetical protein S4054_02805 [Pseudoalteromonas luteoviolacea]KKE83365.1 hypothetical protein N479_14580 [Pseudoalteromonas luteoviolacea S4054]KZN74018.1 hypothetical protein N481_09905 [Pseudoalteromonas luteoviolacea S4047-1]